MSEAPASGLTAFTEYFVCNYPGPDTVIMDPRWHAPRIYRAAVKAHSADLCASGQQVRAAILAVLADPPYVDFSRVVMGSKAAYAVADAVLAALTPAPEAGHPDDLAVDRFAAAMKAKLAKKRGEGRGGWNGRECSAEILSRLLRGHVEKGDPLDVGNLAMMLHQRGDRIEPEAAHAVDVHETPFREQQTGLSLSEVTQAPEAAQAEAVPCGGCGAKSDAERCMGCLHDFGTSGSSWVRKHHPAAHAPGIAEAIETLPRNTYDCGTEWARLEQVREILRRKDPNDD